MRNSMKKIFAIVVLISCISMIAAAQGIHFSQYYNSPMLQNPANTALMSDNDFRLGANYRDQWASVPVPYKTISAFGDCKLFRKEETGSNWMGLGLAFFSDKAGNGDLSLTDIQLSLAYHIQTGEISMFSVGLYGGYIQRSVDYNKLTFDTQWDGFRFNTDMANNEKDNLVKTNYLDAGAGLNYAYFPNESVYLKFGVGVAHANQPIESFYNGANQIAIRPLATVDALLGVAENLTLNPSIYYTHERAASELLYGTLLYIYLGGKKESSTDLIFGVFHRWNEAIVGDVGLRVGGLKFTASYDVTMSKLAVDNQRKGAFEFSIIYLGNYGKMSRSYRSTNCPRF
jgi:type IX secretion system PorP/SprF family membrane protein